MVRRGVILFLLLLLCSFSMIAANQDSYHLKLLAVHENGDGYVGSDADLYLEIKDGSGRVFLDTFPLTKFDTQISTRFAKEVACTHFKLDCEKHDFIYTIKSNSNIIGGPSAGAAIAALTTIGMLDLEYDEGITITGTINSGGTIGPVGGVKEKLDAANDAGLDTVLISKGSGTLSFSPPVMAASPVNETRSEFDVISYARNNLSLNVVEVLTLDDVIKEMTGVDLNGKPVSISLDEDYVRIMKSLRDVLCQRTAQLEQEVHSRGVSFDLATSESIQKKKADANLSAGKGDYYSSASFCFSANIQLRTRYYEALYFSPVEVDRLFQVTKTKAQALKEKNAEQDLDTISALQTFMIVSERLDDVDTAIASYRREGFAGNESYSQLAYAEERFFSALTWMQFFAMDGRHFVVDEDLLRDSCVQKISEGEERAQYAALFVGEESVRHLRGKIGRAQETLNSSEYALCLITASQAKADANAILSTMGQTNETILHMVEAKKLAVEQLLAANIAEGTFPILGYSYYQYAVSLQQDEPITALVYLEYALDMSDLSIYFPTEKTFLQKSTRLITTERVLVLEGFLVGLVLALLAFWIFFRKKMALLVVESESAKGRLTAEPRKRKRV